MKFLCRLGLHDWIFDKVTGAIAGKDLVRNFFCQRCPAKKTEEI